MISRVSQMFCMVLAEGSINLMSNKWAQAIGWLAVIILALVVEAMTTDMVSLWFAPGALVSMILAVFGVNFVIQVVVCIVISIALMLLAKTVFKKYLHKKADSVDTSVSSLVGREVMVTEDIDNHADRGVVKINGQLWNARMLDSHTTAQKGDKLEVVSVNGTTLICQIIP